MTTKSRMKSEVLVCLHVFAGLKSVSFFFSAISAQSRNKGKKSKSLDKPNEDGGDSGDEEISTQSQGDKNTNEWWIADHPTLAKHKLCPCISYWIALSTPNGAPANPLVIHRALLECGVEAIANQVSYY